MPQLSLWPCHRLFTEFDAGIIDVAEGGAWLARMNVRACQRNPRLCDDLMKRCEAALLGYRAGTLGQLPGTGTWEEVRNPVWDPKKDPPEQKFKIDPDTGKPRMRWVPPVPPFAYEDEPEDKWQTFSVMAEDRPRQTIRADCDCLSPTWAAYFYLCGAAKRVGIGVSQPATRKDCPWGKNMCGRGMAHEYTLIDFGGASMVPSGFRELPGVFLDDNGQGVADASVWGGMGEEPPPRGPSRRGPPRNFYGSGEFAHVWIF